PEFLLLRQEVGQRAAVMFCGHNHFPMWVEENGTDDVRLRSVRYFTPLPLRRDGLSIVNPGSVGQPRDGDPRAAYALLDTEAMRMTFHRVAYDIAATQVLMREQKLPRRLIKRLEQGL
ncbi:MAG TPA: metallophosphoesterase family protein, partial [Promineifilum sp.]|nr:metallophosphoesterase family protein [Promineifilum sp.]